MNEIYLAVWHDRHIDDQYGAFRELTDAIMQIKSWQKEYQGEDYRFLKTDIEGYVFHVETGDDGPSGEVIRLELK